jgi:hypothetical protein
LKACVVLVLIVLGLGEFPGIITLRTHTETKANKKKVEEKSSWLQAELIKGTLLLSSVSS